MELAVGQYTRQGPIGAMNKISPFFKGIIISKYLLYLLHTNLSNSQLVMSYNFITKIYRDLIIFLFD